MTSKRKKNKKSIATDAVNMRGNFVWSGHTILKSICGENPSQ